MHHQIDVVDKPSTLTAADSNTDNSHAAMATPDRAATRRRVDRSDSRCSLMVRLLTGT
jgi:hypothetical protein